MRELLKDEMRFVSGGLVPEPPVDLGGVTVHPDPSGGGGGGGGGATPPPSGGGGGSSGSSGGALSASQASGVARIKAELGVDLTTYAQMSPTLAQEIANATATYNWQFDFSANGSSCAYSATSTVEGTIHIDSAYQNNPAAIVEQLSHELSHIDHRVWDDPHKVTSQQYVSDYLTAEGYATLSNEQVRNDILTAHGGDIGVASADKPDTLPLYDAQYARVVANAYYTNDAAVQIGKVYGQYEHVPDGRSYSQVFLENYHNGGGTN
ncbi:MAG TPA: hypothetical protein VNZ27_04710 [Rhodanobacter sp.]|jgi:hypothetical protein|nr:hypothetical protein [Rhodanobacter sp.]